MLNSRFLGGQVDTIIGSYHSNYDLERCRAREAQACFIIADKSKKNPDVEDANVILVSIQAKEREWSTVVIVIVIFMTWLLFECLL